MRSEMLYQSLCWDNLKSVYRMMKNYDDIDILYDDGVIIRLIISKNQSDLLKAVLDYFENKQFPEKGKKYKEASHKLIEILEDASDGIDSSLEICSVISKYIGNDIAVLSDIHIDNIDKPDWEHMHDANQGNDITVFTGVDDVSEPGSELNEHENNVVVNSALPKFSGIGDCISAAKVGDNAVIRQKLDMTNRSHKLIVISTAIQNKQECIIDTIADMVQNDKQKATILRMAGDMYAKCSSFKKAEEYYSKSLEMHPKYYVTYSKLGALYQCWSSEEPSALSQEELKQKAIENYSRALEYKPERVKYAEVPEILETLSTQLRYLQDIHEDSKKDPDEAIEELLSYLPEEDEASSPLGLSGLDVQSNSIDS